MVMEGIQEDMGGSDGSMMQCPNHPYKKNSSSPGGICALCLQEKLGKLVSSSFPSPIFPSSSSSSTSTPSFRSDSASSLPIQPTNNSQSVKIPKIPFQKKKNGSAESSSATTTVFKRSKSSTTPRNRVNVVEAEENEDDDDSPRGRRGFWSFLYHSSKNKKIEKPSVKDPTFTTSMVVGDKKRENFAVVEEEENNNEGYNSHSTHERKVSRSFLYHSSKHKKIEKPSVKDSTFATSMVVRDKKRENFAVVEDEENNEGYNGHSTHERKVSRSRSVGCGSRSFSGDLFERISTGFGDCTLRRVESQREGGGGKTKIPSGQDCIRERVKCGGIFSGFMIIAASSEENHNHNHQIANGRSKNWGWALASPIRAFTHHKPSTGKTEASNKNTSPNLAAIPSLLTVRS